MEYTAIVLRTDPFKENDRIVSLFTLEKGLVRLIAKGSQKITSKNAANFEPGVHCLVGEAAGKELHYITSVEPITYFSNLRSDLLKSAATLFLCQFLARVLKEHESSPILFKDVLLWLTLLDSEVPFQMRMIDAMMLRSLAVFGFSPELSLSVASGATESLVGFSSLQGGLLTKEESRSAIQANENVIACPVVVQEILQTMLDAEWEAIMQSTIASDSAATIHRIIYDYAQYHLEQKITDWQQVIYSFDTM